MAPPAAITSSVASVKKITAVHDCKIDGAIGVRDTAMRHSSKMVYGEFSVAVSGVRPNFKIDWILHFANDGSSNLTIRSNETKRDRLPIVATSHVMKNWTKVRSSNSQRIIMEGEGGIQIDDFEKTELDEKMTEWVDENECLTIRLEISLLPCCLSAGAKGKAYEAFSAIEESQEKNIRTDTLDSLCNDMTSMRKKAAAFSDLNIICQDKSFPVHRAFLSARSEVFAKMLSTDMMEAKKGDITIVDFEPVTVEMFLRYLYESELPPLNMKQASDLMGIADKYNVRPLVTTCKDYLLNNLRPDNLVEVLILGYLCKEDELKDAAISMLGKEIGPLGKLKDWSKLEGYPKLCLEIAEKKWEED